MDWQTALNRIDSATAQAFVRAARHVIDALLIEGQRVQQAQPPAPRDYATAELPRTTPPAGWLSHDELRDTAQRLAEAIAAEKWTDGVLFAVKAFAVLGGAL